MEQFLLKYAIGVLAVGVTVTCAASVTMFAESVERYKTAKHLRKSTEAALSIPVKSEETE